jgi:tRNA-2-methylthio-N6-dimethylallyladenosine synthase
MNQSDSERISHVIEEMGYRRTYSEEEADLLGILSCSVRQKSIDKVYSRIAKWNKWKNKKSLVTFVSGCVLPADKEKFLKLFDIVFQPSEISQLPEMLSQYGVASSYSLEQLYPGLEKREIFDFWQVDPDYQSGFYAYVPIQNGCDKFCSFCAVPYTRGREVSRPSEEIIEEVRKLVSDGYKSVTLLGQNVNSYGLDKKGEEISFAELLSRIGQDTDKSGKECWIYFTSPHPRDMTDEVIEVISKYKSLAKQIHLPLQSGDERVLMRMKRNHSVEKYRGIVDTIRSLIPEATLFTDIIVGFSGETDEQFGNTRKAMEEFKYNMAYIAKYSPRPGALSARWEDDIAHDTKKKRLELLTEELKKHSLEFNRTLVGKTLRLLVYGADKKQGYLTGLTEGKLTVRFPSIEYSLKGCFVDVKISSVTPFAMEGELVQDNRQKEENTVNYEAEHRI